MSNSADEANANLERMTKAAVTLQRFWRRYIDVQVFKYYRDLVVFHNEGDPALIMKYINPIEAKLIDGASGIHIKFRLTGHQFPPSIYYKIFTHRPVQDICANAPRDYTKPYLKIQMAELKNNRNKSSPKESKPHEGWYKRIENNGWRPVSNKNLIQMNLDYYFGVQRDTKPIVFHRTKLERKQDAELKKKRRKIEWMKKMYKVGLLKAKGGDLETNKVIEETTKNLLDIFDNVGIEHVDDWEVNELLKWTNALDFEDYTNTWKKIGTTAESERLINERNNLNNLRQSERANSIISSEISSKQENEFLKQYKSSAFRNNL